MLNNTNVNGGTVDVTGTSAIDNIFVNYIFQENSDYIDINRIKANIHTGGINFYKDLEIYPNWINGLSYEYPKDSGSHTIFCSSFWIGGKNQGKLHLAAERYHDTGFDFYPGPVMDSVTTLTERSTGIRCGRSINRKSIIILHIGTMAVM
jgi:hypothetical protein